MQQEWVTDVDDGAAAPASPPGWSNTRGAQEAPRAVLQNVLSRFYGFGREIVHLTRRVSPYSTSFTLEELDVRLEDGTRLELMCKNLGRASLLPAARRVRPEVLYAPLRGLRVYDQGLRGSGIGTPVCYGVVADEESDRYALFLERVASDKLCHVGDFSVWTLTARWLGAAHARFAPTAGAVRGNVPLVEYDESYYRRWMDRA